MSRKRRIFDIDMPDEPVTRLSPKPAKKRGPMASAIAENAEALKARKDAESAIRAENDALAHEFVKLREAGQVVQSVPLDDVHMWLLTRDRLVGADDDMELLDLITSIREVGLSNPIRVEERADGSGYELIQGFRRLSAYRKLHEDDGAAWSRIPALVLPRGEDVAGLYRRMVDENIVRKDLSFAEMAWAATNYAKDPATPEHDVAGAVKVLFQSAPYSKRSYIRSFARLLDRIGDTLLYPTEIPRKLGVTLAQEIHDRPELVARIRERLHDWDHRAVDEELNVLRHFARTEEMLDDDRDPAVETSKPAKKQSETVANKTTFNLSTRVGRVKCTAADGRLEIKTDRDFSTMDRERLERAIASLIDGLD